MERIFVGIDPDVDGSGVAVLKVDRGVGFHMKPETEIIDISNSDLPSMIDLFARIKESETADKTTIVVEAGWKNHSNWHIPKKAGTHMAAEIGRRTGRNHQIAMDIAAIAQSFGLHVIERLPLIKSWKGKDGKITHDELSYITGMKQKRTNQEQRDALLLAWCESGLPIRVKVA